MSLRPFIITFPDGVPTDEAMAQFLIGAIQRSVSHAPLTLEFAELSIRDDGHEFRVQAVPER